VWPVRPGDLGRQLLAPRLDADLAAQVMTGLVATALAVWWRPGRRELEASAGW
jgi:hypothetical protein